MSFCDLMQLTTILYFFLCPLCPFVSHLSTVCLSISCFKRCVCGVHMPAFFHHGRAAWKKGSLVL